MAYYALVNKKTGKIYDSGGKMLFCFLTKRKTLAEDRIKDYKRWGFASSKNIIIKKIKSIEFYD